MNMSEVIYNKLIRDKIPEIIAADDAEAVVRTLEPEEYKRALLEKLVEEAQELLESGGSLDERVDVEEVLRALDEVYSIDKPSLEAARLHKALARGAFTKRLYLEKTIQSDS